MHEPDGPFVHISSTVVRCRAVDMEAVRGRIESLQGAEVAHCEAGRLIVVLEGQSSGAVGDLLGRITLMAGVVSAAMVYEQVEPTLNLGEER